MKIKSPYRGGGDKVYLKRKYPIAKHLNLVMDFFTSFVIGMNFSLSIPSKLNFVFRNLLY